MSVKPEDSVVEIPKGCTCPHKCAKPVRDVYLEKIRQKINSDASDLYDVFVNDIDVKVDDGIAKIKLYLDEEYDAIPDNLIVTALTKALDKLFIYETFDVEYNGKDMVTLCVDLEITEDDFD
jgi:hypothetical protein